MKRFLSLSLVALLAGCAEVATLPSAGEANVFAWDLRQQALSKLESWSIRGRVAVQTENEGWSATLHWDQRPASYKMRFIAPLGQGTYQLQGDEKLVSFLTAKNELYLADNPEKLLQNNLGWSVPLHGLKYWIKGVPEPGIENENLLVDDQGRMTDLRQSGWQISISRYTDFNGTQMPSKLFMQNDRIKLRLVIQDWQTH